MAGEKTEQATPKRRQDERKKGNVFQSSEVVTVFSLIIVFYSVKLLAPIILAALQGSFEYFFSLGATTTSIGQAEVNNVTMRGEMVFFITTVPLLLICSLVAIIFTFAQTKMMVNFKNMAFKGNRLSPIGGFKKMFSTRAVVEMLKAVIKVTVLAYVVYSILKTELPLLPRMMDYSIADSMAQTGAIILAIVQRVVIAFVFLAAFDLFYQRWEYEKNIRMSKQEIKEEYKQMEGDPQVKGKIRERQQQQSRKRMMQAVPSADVVIRNPTHFAVAIKYDAKSDSAPVVVAKGMDSLALRIVKLAEENDVVITENKPLARGLYDAVELDREIPDMFYQAVAEVLAFVYSIKKKELK